MNPLPLSSLSTHISTVFAMTITHTEIIYGCFAVVLILALLLDLGLMSKKGKEVTIKQATLQTIFWIGLSLIFWGFIWYENGSNAATKYISAYLMEWSLSIDNIFVFILIFAAFKIKETDMGRALLVGILLAIVFRIIFIAVGIGLIDRFHWIMYIFGAFLLYTGIKLFIQKESHEFNMMDSKFFQWVKRTLPFTDEDPNGKYTLKKNGKKLFTSLTLVVIVLAVTDIAFALDSIPTVVSLVKDGANAKFSSSDVLVIYSSNIFAILGLRSLFFLLRGAANKFRFLQQGIAFILIFIGVKMLIEFFHIHIPIGISLGVIVLCVGVSIAASLLIPVKATPTQNDLPPKTDA
ncbi:tellurite resistance protein TerC [Arachidicoccus rhizosphaerae]|uniref:Tellurite resistance protein TerC n=1 Tax=Arachidicoccus rhizosphaerae TaxID=551991 RepID=A0A1H3W482_9BACT|nr:TerC/Alx family metal homeostasis membrane protein [Arachidicoccus rhizosphaerae]SDZ81088.1 tellurite resistance protein TerC [Arachidicoccus rhizosphaerae]